MSKCILNTVKIQVNTLIYLFILHESLIPVTFALTVKLTDPQVMSPNPTESLHIIGERTCQVLPAKQRGFNSRLFAIQIQIEFET